MYVYSHIYFKYLWAVCVLQYVYDTCMNICVHVSIFIGTGTRKHTNILLSLQSYEDFYPLPVCSCEWGSKSENITGQFLGLQVMHLSANLLGTVISRKPVIKNLYLSSCQ